MAQMTSHCYFYLLLKPFLMDTTIIINQPWRMENAIQFKLMYVGPILHLYKID